MTEPEQPEMQPETSPLDLSKPEVQPPAVPTAPAPPDVPAHPGPESFSANVERLVAEGKLTAAEAAELLEPQEAFKVSRNGGTHARQVERVLINQLPAAFKGIAVEADTAISAICEKTLTVKGVLVQVPVFRSMVDVRTLRSFGLDDGMLVAVSGDGGKSGEVYAVFKDDIKTIGQFKPTKSAVSASV